MKKILLLLLFIPFVSFGQSAWNLKNTTSTFDGNQSLIYVEG